MGESSAAKKSTFNPEMTQGDFELVRRMGQIIEASVETLGKAAHAVAFDGEFTQVDAFKEAERTIVDAQKDAFDWFRKGVIPYFSDPAANDVHHGELGRMIADPIGTLRDMMAEFGKIKATFDIDPNSPEVRGDMVRALAEEKLLKLMGKGHDAEIRGLGKEVYTKFREHLKEDGGSIDEIDLSTPKGHAELAARINIALKEVFSKLPPTVKVDAETGSWKAIGKVSAKEVEALYASLAPQGSALTGDKDFDRFLLEIDVDKNEWKSAQETHTEGFLISEKLRFSDGKAHPQLKGALVAMELWLKEAQPYADAEPFRQDLIKAYVAGIGARSGAESSQLIMDTMHAHLKAEAVKSGELETARKIVDLVEEAAKKERETREEKAKKGL